MMPKYSALSSKGHKSHHSDLICSSSHPTLYDAVRLDAYIVCSMVVLRRIYLKEGTSSWGLKTMAQQPGKMRTLQPSLRVWSV